MKVDEKCCWKIFLKLVWPYLRVKIHFHESEIGYKLYLSNLIRKKDLPKERYDGYINLLKFINHFYEYKDSIIINNAIEKNLVTPETKALMDEYGDNLFAQYEIDDLINFIDIIIKISPKHENEYSFYKKIYSIIGIKYKKGYEVLEN